MNNRNKFIFAIVGIVAGVALLVTTSMLAENALINASVAVVLMTVSIIFVLCAIVFAAKVDYETGVYECRNCGHIFKPTFRAYIFGMHTLTTRYLTCPGCGKTTWCKRKNDEK